MGVVGLLVFLVLVGLGLWAVNTMIPMQQSIKTIFNIVVVIIVILVVLGAFGLLGWNMPVPRVR